MKRRLANILLLAATLLCCGTAAAAQEPCRLERAVAPDYGGVMLGMRLEALAQMFPGSEELQKGTQGAGSSSKPFVASLGMLELGVRKEQFRDVGELMLTFLGGTLHRIDVRYRQPVSWREVTEFSAEASKRLAVPADSWGEPASDAEKHSRVLDCRGFSVVVRIDKAGPSTLSIVDTAAATGAAGAAAAPAKAEPAPRQRRPRKGRGGKGKTG
ncbi:MAG: hypothetical protein QOH49_1757 [Acidobacteriota bacterium]|jgi:hypothetical protein|nr:hypothetical protein [Acidobacteriota bacterium]